MVPGLSIRSAQPLSLLVLCPDLPESSEALLRSQQVEQVRAAWEAEHEASEHVIVGHDAGPGGSSDEKDENCGTATFIFTVPVDAADGAEVVVKVSGDESD